MKYHEELNAFNFQELKIELKKRVSDHRTIDQQRVKITGLLTAVLQRMNRST